MAQREVAVRLRARVEQYQADLRKAANETNAFSTKATAGMKSVTKATADLGPTARVSAGIALAAMGAFAAKSIAAASDLNETVSKTGVLFGKSAGQIEAWASTASTSLGQSKKQAMDAAASFAVFGKSAGLSGDALVNFSKQNVQLASDMASFFNTSPEDAINAIGSAFRGEAEPIRAYGILLDDATLRQAALEQGLISTTKNALTPQQKVLAAQAVIMKQTGDAQGDFARTSDGLANSQRILAAQFEDTQAQLGQALLPVALKATEAMGAMLKVANGLPEPVKMTGAAAAVAVAGFIMLAPRIVATVDAFKSLRETSPRAAGAIGTMGKAMAAYAAVALVASTRTRDVNSGSNDMVGLLTQIAGSGKGIDELGFTIQGITTGVHDFNDAIERTQTANFFDGLDKGFSSLFGAASMLGQSEDAVKGVVDPLVQMVRNGDANLAAAAFERLRDNYAASGRSIDDFNAAFKPYLDAVDAAKPKTDEFSFSQQTLKDKAAAAKREIQALTEITKAWQGLADRDAATDAMAAGYADLAEAVKKNKGSLDGNTEAARNARSAFRDSMGDIAAYAETFKDPQKKAEALRDGLDTMRTKLGAMGLSDAEIARLVKPYQKLATEAANAAAQQDKIDRDIRISITTTYGPGSSTYDSQVPDAAKPKKPKKKSATGGPVFGPGTSTSDSIPALLSNGEYVINARSAAAIGFDTLDMINRYAKGGKVARKTSGGTNARRAARTAAVEKVTSLRADRASAIESTASSMSSAFGLMGAFDFGAQARAIDDLASAQERLASASEAVADADGAVFEARRAVNAAGSPRERADAEKRMAEALERQAKARAGRSEAEGDVVAAKVAVKKTAATPGNVLAAWQGRLRALVNFRKNLDALRKKGFAPSIIAEIASDPDGAEVAAALVKATPSQVKAFNATDAALSRVSGAVGRIAGGAQYDNSIRAAQQRALGLGATAKQVGSMTSRFNQPLVVHSHVHVGRRELAVATADLSRREGGYSWD